MLVDYFQFVTFKSFPNAWENFKNISNAKYM